MTGPHGAVDGSTTGGHGPVDGPMTGGRLPVIGIGEDGWDGLTLRARTLLQRAAVIIGSPRQLALLPPALHPHTEPWPSPMRPRLEALARAARSGSVDGRVILASGDPMLHGVGASLAALTGPDRLEILPVPSAYALACARLGWAQHTTPLLSFVADPGTELRHACRPGARLIAYVPAADGATTLARALVALGHGAARFVVLERLGGPAERRLEHTAQTWAGPADPLHLVAVEFPAGPAGPADASTAAPASRLDSPVPGLPDALFGGDGQLTRAEVRAVALAALAPRPGERLWDVGAGSGTIAIEWCRAVPAATAIAIERRADRAATIAANATRLGAPGITVTVGAAPLALDGLAAPDAIFVGGGPALPGLLARCWTALRPGGRLVANAVTLQGEQALAAAFEHYGGRLVRLELAHAEPLGGFTGWKPQRPVVQWSVVKPVAASTDPPVAASTDPPVAASTDPLAAVPNPALPAAAAAAPTNSPTADRSTT